MHTQSAVPIIPETDSKKTTALEPFTLTLSPLVLRQAIDDAITKLQIVAAVSHSELVRGKLRRAYKHLQLELEQIDTDVLLALEQEVA